MPGKAGEIGFDPTQQQGALRQGLEVLDQMSEYELQPYTRVVLPIDGYVFWQPAKAKIKVKGSLHYGLETLQNPDEVVGDGTIVFTAEDQIMTFAQTAAPMIYVLTIGENDTDDPKKNPVRFAFSQQGHFYAQAGIWHYTGRRILPALVTQLLDPGNTVDQTRAIVSNSLPLWLATNNYTPPYAGLSSGITLYPSYEVAENIAPPYGVVDILKTEPVQGVPLLGGQFGAHTQLVKDTIEVTLYGMQNNACLTFQDFINQYSLDTDAFGVMNMPVVSDPKRPQPEIKTIAMKKTIAYEVSYYQSQSVAVARKLIATAPYAIYLQPGP